MVNISSVLCLAVLLRAVCALQPSFGALHLCCLHSIDGCLVPILVWWLFLLLASGACVVFGRTSAGRACPSILGALCLCHLLYYSWGPLSGCCVVVVTPLWHALPASCKQGFHEGCKGIQAMVEKDAFMGFWHGHSTHGQSHSGDESVSGSMPSPGL